MVKFSVRLDDELVAKLKDMARRAKRSLNGEIAYALELYVGGELGKADQGGNHAAPPKRESIDDVAVEVEAMLLSGVPLAQIYGELVLREWNKIEERMDRGAGALSERVARKEVVERLAAKEIDPRLALEVIRECAPHGDIAVKIEQEIYDRAARAAG